MINTVWPDTFEKAAELLRAEDPINLVERLDALRAETPAKFRKDFDIYYEGAALILATTEVVG